LSKFIKEEFDYAVPLEDEALENFVQEYYRLDTVEKVWNETERKHRAYIHAFPEDISTKRSIVLQYCNKVLRRKTVTARLEYLYDEYGTGVENKIKWNKRKAEDVLLEVISGGKDADRIKAVSLLNELRKIGVEEDVESKIDTVSAFFAKFGKDK